MSLLGSAEVDGLLKWNVVLAVAGWVVDFDFGDSGPMLKLQRRTQTYSPARWTFSPYFRLFARWLLKSKDYFLLNFSSTGTAKTRNNMAIAIMLSQS
jgi:hypothetical protein